MNQDANPSALTATGFYEAGPLNGRGSADPNPAAVYLASLAEGPGRVAMRSTLHQVAVMLGCPAADACPW